jgi:hypothetical protein
MLTKIKLDSTATGSATMWAVVDQAGIVRAIKGTRAHARACWSDDTTLRVRKCLVVVAVKRGGK